MVDPISIFGLVTGSASLISSCASAIQSLNDLAGRYGQAKLTIISMISEVDTIEFAWKRIKEWLEDYAEASTDDELLGRLDRSLECGTLVITALQKDLLEYGSETLSVWQRSQVAWNEKALQDHQYRIRGQVQAMSLLLQVLELPTRESRTKLLQTSHSILLKSDESAYSIVPSRMSRVSSDMASSVAVNSAELVYRQLSCDDELFTARVYKRNYRNRQITSLFDHKFAATAKRSLGLLDDENGIKDGSANDPDGVDIVAIHGLLGHPFKTWTHPKTQHLWLRDSLHKHIPGVRILPYTYPSQLLLSHASVTLRGFAEKLLVYLKCVRGEGNKRRIIFVAHNLGGLIGKQALMVAREHPRYMDIYGCILGIIFFGTPDSKRPALYGQKHEYLSTLFSFYHDRVLALNEGKEMRSLFAILEHIAPEVEDIDTTWKSLRNRPESFSFFESDFSTAVGEGVRSQRIFQVWQDADFMPDLGL